MKPGRSRKHEFESRKWSRKSEVTQLPPCPLRPLCELNNNPTAISRAITPHNARADMNEFSQPIHKIEFVEAMLHLDEFADLDMKNIL